MMKRIGKHIFGLVLAGAIAAGHTARAAAGAKVAREPGPAYELIGKVAVLHEGPHQAAGHGRPRRGQADLRPRDDQAA